MLNCGDFWRKLADRRSAILASKVIWYEGRPRYKLARCRRSIDTSSRRRLLVVNFCRFWRLHCALSLQDVARRRPLLNHFRRDESLHVAETVANAPRRNADGGRSDAFHTRTLRTLTDTPS